MSNLDRLAYNKAGMMFTAANVSAKNFPAVTTSATGVILFNPSSSKTLYVVEYGFSWTTAPSAVHNIGLGIMAPNNTQPSSLTAIGSGVQSCKGFGNADTAVGLVWDAATLPAAPVARRWLGGAVYGSGVAESPFTMIDVVDGAIAVPMNAAAVIIGLTTTLAGVGFITWVEIPN